MFLEFFFIFFLEFLNFFFFNFCWIFKVFGFLFGFLEIFWIIFEITIRSILKVTKVTAEHQKWSKINTNSVKSSCFARRAKKALDKGQSPPHNLKVSPRSGLYLLAFGVFSSLKIFFYLHGGKCFEHTWKKFRQNISSLFLTFLK